MFDTENKMRGLTLLYTSADIDAILKWGKEFYKNKTLSISPPVDGVRFFVKNHGSINYKYSSIVIQENKKYKVYG